MISFAEAPQPEPSKRAELLLEMIVNAAVDRFKTLASIPDGSRVECSVSTKGKFVVMRWEAIAETYTFAQLGFSG